MSGVWARKYFGRNRKPVMSYRGMLCRGLQWTLRKNKPAASSTVSSKRWMGLVTKQWGKQPSLQVLMNQVAKHVQA